MNIASFIAKCVEQYGPDADEFLDTELHGKGVLRYKNGIEYALSYGNKIMFGKQGIANEGRPNEYYYAELLSDKGNILARLEDHEKRSYTLYISATNKEIQYMTWEDGEVAMAKVLMG